MPTCCPYERIPFIDEEFTVIAYTPLMQSQYGPTPRVQVYYYDPETGEFYLSGFFTRIEFAANTITIDHGGPQRGHVVIR